jgi:ABC-type uncharacterized transport system involved in gliding motility auxiliary subunit
MIKKFKKYAPVGLVVGLIAAAAALILRVSAGQFTLLVKVLIGVAILGIVLFVILDPQSILDSFKGRRAKYGGNATIMTLAVIGILIIVNLFIYNNDVSWDLTEDKENTLSSESLEMLRNLDVPVYAQAFYSTNTSTDSAETLLSNFKRNANGMFDYEFIDPYQNPVLANQAGITRDGTVVLTTGETSEQLSYLSEENLLNSIIKLQNPETTAVYVLTGHGEDDFFTAGDFSMTDLQQALVAKNYVIDTLNLVATPSVPEDAQAIIIAAPQIMLEDSEVQLIGDYLDKGGSLILFSEPPFLTQVDTTQTNPLWSYLQENWGIMMANNLVIDLTIDPVEYAVADQYTEHAITDEVLGYITFFPTSHSVDTEILSGITATDLILTSSQSWAETDIEAILNGEVAFDESADTAGPINIATALENTTTGARVLIVGDSDFASDSYIQAYGNRDLVIGMVDWVSANENLISLTTTETTTRVLVPPTKATQLLIYLVGLVGLPLTIAAIGIIIGIRRKRTG